MRKVILFAETSRVIHAISTEEQASRVAGNGSVPYESLFGSNRSKSSSGSKRFERIEIMRAIAPGQAWERRMSI